VDVAARLDPWLLGTPTDWTECAGRTTLPTRSQVLELAVQISRRVPGHLIEFGVYKGYSIRVMRDELWRTRLYERSQWRKRIYACDSFDGLPDAYEHLPAGTFATPVPRMLGVRVVNGFFDRTLTPALATEVGQVSLAHLDADLYGSTVTALNWLTPLLGPGSVLLFDEFVGEDPAEARAFVEWTARTGLRTMLLAYFVREPSGKGGRTDRRALFQVVGDQQLTKAPPLPLVKWRRRLSSTW